MKVKKDSESMNTTVAWVRSFNLYLQVSKLKTLDGFSGLCFFVNLLSKPSQRAGKKSKLLASLVSLEN